MQAISYYLSLPFIYLFSSLPLSFLYFLSDYLVFPVLYHLIGYRRKVVRENLKNSFPEKSPEEIDAIEEKYFHYLSDLFMEIFKGFTISKKELAKKFTFESTKEYEDLFNEGKNLIMSLGHYGNHEWGAMIMPRFFKHQAMVPYRRFTNPYFARLFNRSRSLLGTHLFPTQDTYREIALSKGKPFALCLANDQAAPPDKSFWTKFLNQDTCFFVGTEKIAHQINAPVFYARIQLISRGHYHVSFDTISMDPKSEPEGAIMEKHARFLEADIRNKPEFWLWSHRRWKHKMPEGTSYGFTQLKH